MNITNLRFLQTNKFITNSLFFLWTSFFNFLVWNDLLKFNFLVWNDLLNFNFLVWNDLLNSKLIKFEGSHFSVVIYPPITYYWTVPLILDHSFSRWEVNKFKNCLYKSVRILEVLKLLFQQYLNLSSSQRDKSGPILGDCPIIRDPGVL
jgi:hypothetical protein